MFAGLAGHSFLSLGAPITAGYGLMLGVLGHVVGWPLPRGRFAADRRRARRRARRPRRDGRVRAPGRLARRAATERCGAARRDAAPGDRLGRRRVAEPVREDAHQVPVRAGRVQGRLGARRADPVDERRLQTGGDRPPRRNARRDHRGGSATCSAAGSPSGRSCCSRSRACSTRAGRRPARTPRGPTATCRTGRPST